MYVIVMEGGWEFTYYYAGTRNSNLDSETRLLA